MTGADAREECVRETPILKASLDKMFPKEEYTVVCFMPDTSIFKNTLTIKIIGVPKGSSELGSLNSKIRIVFMFALDNDSGRLVDSEKFSIELTQLSYQLKNAGLKFRKITAKSPKEALSKLLKWIQINEKLIKSV